ncbi:hypothetical protein M404DRAFT_35384 [Pisolithus tinctorius Marx 270]|uniref:Uncharacterized protein n=1 Tax=Pisolithus tinctorius Marx 270 TaxID=870435 RepID=A0A0C3IAH6_PISTI|nr:hypothetical protein M404DRAFT_35384 [Pisolithus tinctorius Marx 270]
MASQTPLNTEFPLFANTDLLQLVLEYCDMRDLITFAATSTTNAKHVRWYLRHQLDVICTSFFPTSDHLTNILSACDAVVSGSAALRMVLPAHACHWLSSDLDIYVPLHSHKQLYNLLQQNHYNIICNGKPNVQHYSASSIFTVTTFGNGQSLINIIISKTVSALSPIFQFYIHRHHELLLCRLPILRIS